MLDVDGWMTSLTVMVTLAGFLFLLYWSTVKSIWRWLNKSAPKQLAAKS